VSRDQTPSSSSPASDWTRQAGSTTWEPQSPGKGCNFRHINAILTLTQATSKVSSHTSADILTRTPFLPATCFTLHRQRGTKRKQDLHLSRKRKRLHGPQLSAPCDIPDSKALQPVFQGQAEMLLTSLSSAAICCRAQICCRHACTGHINLNTELYNLEPIQETDENPGQNSPKPRKHLNRDARVLTQALAITSLKRITVAAEHLTAPCSNAAGLKAEQRC